MLDESQRYLIVLSALGLGNRLMALGHFSPIARYTDRQIRIHWPEDNAVAGASFSCLYDDPLEVSLADLQRVSKGSEYRYLPLDYGISGTSDADLDRINAIPALESRYVVARLSCYFQPDFIEPVAYFSQVREFLTGLGLNPSLRTQVERFCARHEIHPDNPDLMGVHIRRTDGQRRRELSTDGQFIEIIDRELDCNARTRFFLATDSEHTERMFTQRFGDRLIVFPKQYRGRDLRQTSLEQSVCDLYILATTHYIYGSYGSSFSKLASVLRGCKFHQVGYV